MARKTFDAMDPEAALESLAQSFPSAKPESANHEDAPKPKATAKPASIVKKLKEVTPVAVASEPEHPLTVRIPQYVAKALRLRYAETGKSQRTLVLEALKASGIKVHDEDLLERKRGPKG